MVTSNLARKVKLYRQETVFGHKRLIYAIDSADDTRVSVRELTKEFFKESLGFKDNEIEFVNRDNFYENEAGLCKTRLSEDE